MYTSEGMSAVHMWTQGAAISCAQEDMLDQYEALQEVRLRTLAQTPDQAFLAGGDVRIGEYILLVDSDTRVPEHCILPTVTELMLSPEVAFTQHYTTPLQVGHRRLNSACGQCLKC